MEVRLVVAVLLDKATSDTLANVFLGCVVPEFIWVDVAADLARGDDDRGFSHGGWQRES